MKKLLLGSLIAVFLLSGCTDKDKAQRILQKEGYENIIIGGYSFFGCSSDDIFRTDFTATKDGNTIDGTVCGGWISGSVVRIK